MHKFIPKFYFFFFAFLLLKMSAQAQTPGGVHDSLKLWLKGNAGTTLNTANNVTQWNDLSGAGVTGNFSTANGLSNQQPPAFQEAGINFNPNINFTSTNPNALYSGNVFQGNLLFNAYNNTLFQIIKLKQSSGTGVWLKWQFNQSGIYGRYGNEVNNGTNPGKMRMDFPNDANSFFSNTVILNKQELVGNVMSQTGNAIRLKGSIDASQSAYSTAFAPTTAGRFSIGNEYTGNALPTSIEIAEIILFKRALTALETNKVESYLAVKYGFTLSQTGTYSNNYTAANGTVIWTNSSNATYGTRITGIGRDDSSALSQKQSLSVETDGLVTMYNGQSYATTFPLSNVANTNTFTDNNSFVLFGDNNLDTSLTECSDSGRSVRMARVWKVQTTNNAGQVTLSVPTAGVPALTSAILVSTDPTFSTGVQSYTLTNNNNTLSAAVTLPNNAYFTFSTAPIAFNPEVHNAMCQGNDGYIKLNPEGGLNPTYSWNTTPVQTTDSAMNLSPGNYTVTVTQNGISGCSYTKTIQVLGNQMGIGLVIDSIENTTCTASIGKVYLHGLSGTEPYEYGFNNLGYQSSSPLTGVPSGSILVQLKDAIGCLKDTTISVGINTYQVLMEYDTLPAWCDAGGNNGSITVRVKNGALPFTYIWSTGQNNNQNSISNLTAGLYNVNIKDNLGCEGDTNMIIREIPCCRVNMPSAFSPNGDGQNDLFRPKNLGIVGNFKLMIYNRYGQMIYTTYDPNVGWPGIDGSGNRLPMGTYFYYIEYNCQESEKNIQLKGDVTLIY